MELEIQRNVLSCIINREIPVLVLLLLLQTHLRAERLKILPHFRGANGNPSLLVSSGRARSPFRVLVNAARLTCLWGPIDSSSALPGKPAPELWSQSRANGIRERLSVEKPD